MDIFEETIEEKIFGDFSFDQSEFIKKNKYDVVDIRGMTCERIIKDLDKDSKDRLNKIINKMSRIFEEHIINTINSNTSDDDDLSEDPIISSLLLDTGKLAMLYAAFSTEMIPSDNYGNMDLRPYNLSRINTSVLNAGIFSRAGNQVRLSQIINQLGFLNDTNFIEEYNKRINMETDKTFNIMINVMASYITPFGSSVPTIFDRTWLNVSTLVEKTSLDESISFVQLIYRYLGGDDTIKQGAAHWFDPTTIPSLTEIHKNTIKFIIYEDRKLVFEYKNGIMKITKIYVHPHWIETLWNIVMLEMRARCEPIVGSITNFYMGIIKTEEDFYLAYHLGMIYGGPMNFNQFHDVMYKLAEISHYNSTSDASLHVKNLIDKVASLQKNTLLQLYIISGENIWMRVVNVSAAIILLLTVLQTVLSFMSYKASLDQCTQNNNTFIIYPSNL